MIEVRSVQPEDVEWVLSEIKKFSDFYGTKHPPMGDVQHIRNLIEEFSKNHVFIVAENKTVGLMGFIAAMFSPHLFNPKIKCFSCVVLWIAEPYRNSRGASILLKKFIEIGKAKADWTILGVSNKCPLKGSSLENLGLKQTEQMFLMETEATPCPY